MHKRLGESGMCIRMRKGHALKQVASGLLTGIAGFIALAYFWQASVERGLYADATHTDGAIRPFDASIFISGTLAVAYAFGVLAYIVIRLLT